MKLETNIRNRKCIELSDMIDGANNHTNTQTDRVFSDEESPKNHAKAYINERKNVTFSLVSTVLLRTVNNLLNLWMQAKIYTLLSELEALSMSQRIKRKVWSIGKKNWRK